MIEAHELTKRYGEKTAVDGISFTIAPGSVTGFLGPNGAGLSNCSMRAELDEALFSRSAVRIGAYREA